MTSDDQRTFGLDVLRVVSIIVVLVLHGFMGFFIGTGRASWAGWTAVVGGCVVFAVEWFFVLSGFLIGGMLIRGFEMQGHGWISVRNFWLRRWFRTLPNYYLFLAINAFLVWWGLGESRFSWLFAVFAQGLAWPPDDPLFFAEAWSLAVEEWFYLLLPLLLAGLAWLRSRRGHAVTLVRLFWTAAVLLIALPTLVRCALAPPPHFFAWDGQVRRITLLHLDAPGWGVLAAVLSRWHPRWWARGRALKALLGLALILLAVAALAYGRLIDWRGLVGGRINDLFLTTAPALGVMLMLPWISGLRAPRAHGARWVHGAVTRVSNWTYSLYLCHLPILLLLVYVARQWLADVGAALWWLIPLWLVLIFVVAALLFWGFERPVTRWRERLTRAVPAGPFNGR
jgi:peptidoglycan/LPS O-acetylase OafA/YrhL